MASSCAQPLGESGSLPGACSTSSGEFMCSTSPSSWALASQGFSVSSCSRSAWNYAVHSDLWVPSCSRTRAVFIVQWRPALITCRLARSSACQSFQILKTRKRRSREPVLAIYNVGTHVGVQWLFSRLLERLPSPNDHQWGQGRRKKGARGRALRFWVIMIKQVTVLCEFRRFYFVVMDFQVWEFVFSYTPWWLVRTRHQRQWLCLRERGVQKSWNHCFTQKSWMDVNSKRILDIFCIFSVSSRHLVHIVSESQNTSNVTKSTKTY